MPSGLTIGREPCTAPFSAEGETWTHEDHGATYSGDTWVDQILPTQGIAISDRQLAIDLLKAAALHAGGLHTTPTERLVAYHPSELVTAMATIHVGLLRLYSGLEGSNPAKVLRDQLGDRDRLRRFATRRVSMIIVMSRSCARYRGARPFVPIDVSTRRRCT